MKSRIHIATRTALQLIRVEVGPCSRRLAAGARLPSLLQGTATSPSAGPASATLADRWKLAVLGGRSGALFGTSAFAHASSLSSVLVGLAHTTMLRNSKTGSAMPSAPLQARAFSSSSTGLSGNEQTTNKGTEPKTDLKAVIAQYGAVGAVTYFLVSTFVLFTTYFLVVTLGYDSAYLLDQITKAKAYFGMSTEQPEQPPEPNFVLDKVREMLGLDPVLLGICFVLTTPLAPLQLAATLVIARRILARTGTK